MEKLRNGEEQPKIVPELAESFETEFLSAKNEAIRGAMAEIGGFCV